MKWTRLFLGISVLASHGMWSLGAPETGETTEAREVKPDTVRHLLEAEEFEGLPFYGNWYHKAGLGWYVKEHRHASGRAVAVCDDVNQNAVMTKELESPIPPGETKLFLRVALMRMGPGNQVKVALGTLEGGRFKQVESVYFKWRLGSGYGWLGQTVDLPEPCTHLRIEPTIIACKGIGDVPEVPQAQIILDRLVVSNERRARLIPDPSGRGRTELELPKEPDASLREGATTGKAVSYPRSDKSRLKFKTASRPEPRGARLDCPTASPEPATANLVPNGSFEYTLRPFWSARANYYHGYDLGIENLDTDYPTHGRHCLRLALTPTNYMRTKGSPRFGASVVGQPFPVKANTAYWISVNARTNYPGLRLSSTFGSFEMGVKWKRYSAKVTTGPQQTRFSVNLTARAKAPGRIVWLDELGMREAGPEAKEGDRPISKFDVRNKFEVGLRAEAVGEVFYDDAPVQFSVVAMNTRLARQQEVLELRILGDGGGVVDAISVPLDVPPYDTREETISLSSQRRGAFLAVYWLKNSPHPLGRLAFCVVPNPRDVFGKKPFIGTYCQSVDVAMKLCARIGIDWNAPLNDRAFQAPYIMPSRDKHLWFDGLVEKWNARGIDFVGETVPNNKPKWDKGVLGAEPAAGASRPFFQLDTWRQHVREMVEHYEGISHWILTDEAEFHRAAADFAPYVRAVHEELAKLDRTVRVMFSARAEVMDEVAEILGSSKVLDIFGGSRFMAGRWVYEKDREFCKRHGVPTWHTGLGYPASEMYELVGEDGSLDGRKALVLRRRLNEQAFDLMLQTSVVEPERYAQYSGKLDGSGDPYCLFSNDSSFRPHAVQYVNSLQFLRGMRRGGALRPNRASFIQGCYALKDEWTYVALNTSGPRGDYLITIETDPRAVSVLDRNFNPVETSQSDNRLQFELPGEELRVLRDISGRSVQFVDSVRRLQAEPFFTVRCAVLPGSATQNLLGLSIVGRPLGCELSEGTLTVFGQPIEVVLGDEPQLHVFQLPRSFGTRPITNLPVEFQLECGDGFVYRDKCLTWAVTAPPVSAHDVTVDGKLDEWRGQTPIFVYASQALDGSYRTQQARVGGHLIKELPDSSARIWCRWTPDHLVFAADVLDDDLQFAPAEPEPGRPGDQLIFLLDADLLSDLHHSGRTSDDLKLVLGPGASTDPHVRIVDYNGAEKLLAAQMVAREGGYSVEFALPWSVFGESRSGFFSSGNVIVAMGFDAVLRDADGSKLLKSELAWAGHYGADDDPLAYGQLILLPGYQGATSGMEAGSEVGGGEARVEAGAEVPPQKRISEPVTDGREASGDQESPGDTPKRARKWKKLFRKKQSGDGTVAGTEVEKGEVREVSSGRGKSDGPIPEETPKGEEGAARGPVGEATGTAEKAAKKQNKRRFLNRLFGGKDGGTEEGGE